MAPSWSIRSRLEFHEHLGKSSGRIMLSNGPYQSEWTKSLLLTCSKRLLVRAKLQKTTAIDTSAAV